MSKGPMYGQVILLESLPFAAGKPGVVRQQLPSQADLEAIMQDHPRVVAGYEVLLAHYYALRDACEAALDPDPCELDHHGYCQAHGLGRPCPQQLIRNALKT